MTVRVRWRERGDRPRFIEYEIRIRLPNGSDYLERQKSPVAGKDNTERWARKREEFLVSHGLNDDGIEVPTLDSFYEDYKLRHVAANDLKPSQKESIDSIFRTHLSPRFGKIPLNKITTAGIQDMKGALIESGRSKKTVNNILTVINTMINAAIEWKLVSLAEKPRIKLLKRQKETPAYFDFEAFETLVAGATVAGKMHLAMVLLGGNAGLRAGEMSALKWSDVDFKRNELTVRRNYWKGKVLETKGYSTRTIPMTSRLAKALLAIARRPEKTVLHTSRTEIISQTGKVLLMVAAQRAALLEPDGSLHKLRHTFASHLVMRGVPLKTIQELMGHATIGTTMIYAHLSQAHKATSMQVLEVLQK